jgi:glutathione peroxidase
VLGFPCNQFGAQEPGSDAEILEFATSTYGVTFPLFAKVDVNGDDAAPLYQFLRAEQPGDGDSADIAWNFTKFLVARDGTVVTRYEPMVTPEEIAPDLTALLG